MHIFLRSHHTYILCWAQRLKSILHSQNPDIFNTRLSLTFWTSSQYSLQSKLYLKAHKPQEKQLLKCSKLLFCYKKMPYIIIIFWYSWVTEWGHHKGCSIRCGFPVSWSAHCQTQVVPSTYLRDSAERVTATNLYHSI